MPERKTNGHSPVGFELPGQGPLLSRPAPGSFGAKSKVEPLTTAGLCVLLFVLVTWVFLPAIRSGFLGYDDNLFVTANPYVQSGLTWQSVNWAFRNPVVAIWHPLTLLSHMLDCQLYGLKPWGHHLTSVLLHALNTVLLFLVFRRMTGAVWRCAVLAALFGLHPLRVESVAWVAERKDVLSALFFLLTLWAYARFAKVQSLKSRVQSQEAEVGSQALRAPATDNEPRTQEGASRITDHVSRFTLHATFCYLLSLAFFALGLMCKPMVVTLPFVLLLLDFWPLRRLAIGVCQPGNTRGLGRSGVPPLQVLLEKLPFFILAAVSAVITFLVQTQAGFVATNLPTSVRIDNALVSYLRYLGKVLWPADLSVFYPYPRALPTWLVIAAAVLLLAALAMAVRLASRRPYLLVGWLWFCGTLVPVIGLVQVGDQSMADRYSYLPSVGLFIMLVWGIHGVSFRWRYRAAVLAALTLAVLVLCITLTRRQIGYWKDNESLFSHALAVTENNDLAHFNLGAELASRGAFAEAIPHLAEAVRINPNKADGHMSLADALAQEHRFAEAIPQYQAALRLKPNDAETHANLGRALFATGQLAEAIAQYSEAARLEPKNPQAHYDLGVAFTQRGDSAKAAAQLELSLELEPQSAPAHYVLATILRAQRHTAEALAHWRAAARLAPQWPDPINNLAWTLATGRDAELRNGPEAVKLAARAVELSRTNNATFLDTLAAAYAEAGHFAEAASTARAAQAKALAQGRPDLAEQIHQRLALYGSRQPYREAAGAK